VCKEQLKSCPFCTAKIEEGDRFFMINHSISCFLNDRTTVIFKDDKNKIEAWNRRVT